MIKSINLKCFRKHESLEVNLTEGLQTFRGGNEAGKTTILEGASYALFGAKALRNSLAETVTWGHKDTELGAKVVLSMDKDYVFTRSKAGAEVTIDGKVFITGQVEVTNFAASLLGADASTASNLMMSGQGGLRGVLVEGPKATSNLIEVLADLDIVDRIIDAATEKLQLGSTAILTDRLKSAELALKDLVPVDEPKPIDKVASEAAIAAQKEIVAEAEAALKVSAAALQVEDDKRVQAQRLEQDRVQVLNQAEDTALQLAAEKLKVTAKPDTSGIIAAIANAEDWEARAKAWRTFKSMSYGDLVLPLPSFLALEKRCKAELADLLATVARCKGEIKVLEPQVATSHTCPACGQDTAHLEEVKLKQAQVKADLEAARAALVKADAAMPEAMENMQEIEVIQRIEAANQKLAASLANYVEAHETTYPTTFLWKGEEFVEHDVAADIEAYKARLKQAQDVIAAITRAETRVEAMQEVIAACSRRNAEIDAKLKALTMVDDVTYDKLSQSVAIDQAALQQATGHLALLTLCYEGELETFNAQYVAWKAYDVRKAELGQNVTQLALDIETTEFNNMLVKKVRAARPVIANKLWNLVLSTVSTLFSQMRGETSVVTKGKDGFMVNGRPVESLSGSTLDILGLAIRCALIKTFVPNCPFLVLDEPSAACDDGRSAALVGFVAAAGFKQILLVTHEDISEALSTNLIQI